MRSQGREASPDAAGPPSPRCQPACVGSSFSTLLRQASRFAGILLPRPYFCPCGDVCVRLAWPGILRPSHCGPPGGERGSAPLSFGSVSNFSRSFRGTSCLATLPQLPARREGWARAPQVSHRQPTSTCMRLRRIDSCGVPLREDPFRAWRLEQATLVLPLLRAAVGPWSRWCSSACRSRASR